MISRDASKSPPGAAVSSTRTPDRAGTTRADCDPSDHWNAMNRLPAQDRSVAYPLGALHSRTALVARETTAIAAVFAVVVAIASLPPSAETAKVFPLAMAGAGSGIRGRGWPAGPSRSS